MPRSSLLPALARTFQGREAPLEHDHAARGEIFTDPGQAIHLARKLFDPSGGGADPADLVERVLKVVEVEAEGFEVSGQEPKVR